MDRDKHGSPIQNRVIHTLAEADETLAVAESITGGLVGTLLTDVPGASDVFDRSLVTYTHAAKREELDVEEAVLSDVGAVSEIVAEQMARGVRNVAGTTWGLSTTGIAGPPDDVHDQPVGTVYVGVARAREDEETSVSVRRYDVDGSRSEIKETAARQALEDLQAMVSV